MFYHVRKLNHSRLQLVATNSWYLDCNLIHSHALHSSIGYLDSYHDKIQIYPSETFPLPQSLFLQEQADEQRDPTTSQRYSK
jgi:hypothetical protein